MGRDLAGVGNGYIFFWGWEIWMDLTDRMTEDMTDLFEVREIEWVILIKAQVCTQVY